MTGKKYLTGFVLSGLLGAGLLLATGKPAFAEKDWGPACHDRLEAARAKIDQDVARHGENSHQVRNDQVKLDDARRWCRDHHSDWDHTRFDVGVYLRP
jgi:hypothetical protein